MIKQNTQLTLTVGILIALFSGIHVNANPALINSTLEQACDTIAQAIVDEDITKNYSQEHVNKFITMFANAVFASESSNVPADEIDGIVKTKITTKIHPLRITNWSKFLEKLKTGTAYLRVLNAKRVADQYVQQPLRSQSPTYTKPNVAGPEELAKILPKLKADEIAKTLLEYIALDQLDSAMSVLDHMIEQSYFKSTNEVYDMLFGILKQMQSRNIFIGATYTAIRAKLIKHAGQLAQQGSKQQGVSETPAPSRKSPILKPIRKKTPPPTATPQLTRASLPMLSKSQLSLELYHTFELQPKGIFNIITLANNKKILVIGDIHAGCDQLITTINKMREDGRFKTDNPWQLQDEYYLIFTGDLADRGTDGLGVWQIAMTLTQNNPGKCFIMHGNHETSNIARTYGFFEELSKLYPNDIANELFSLFLQLFDRLPHLLIIGIRLTNENASFGLYCHGGLDMRFAAENIKLMLIESMQQQSPLLISKGIEDMRIDQSSHRFSRQDNGFNWSDFALLPSGKLFEWGSRGADAYTISPTGVVAALDAYATSRASVDYIIRGHYHTACCVSILDHATATWKCVKEKQVITHGSVFSIMCLSSAADTYDATENKQAGYALIQSDSKNNLTITPCIAP